MGEPKTIAIVCGGRTYGMAWRDDKDAVIEERVALVDTLAAVAPNLIIHGACVLSGEASGADLIADMWASRNKVDAIRCPAPFAAFGRVAGPARNGGMLALGQAMAKTLDARLVVVAAPGGRGTASMVRLAKAAGVDVVEVERG